MGASLFLSLSLVHISISYTSGTRLPIYRTQSIQSSTPLPIQHYRQDREALYNTWYCDCMCYKYISKEPQARKLKSPRASQRSR
ncbi:hypothetical protein ACN42_g10165 [Penicillium freii]|uniref:Secreted protein n=1 Tax=Penicillium freii TaxID=48697 RepID=A0A101MAU4_PENFR|nr:hypothetical protein ACN42_g10165 [Penicillium freii]